MGTITKPFVLTIFDMIPERFPQFFPGTPPVVEAKKTLALHAAHIITDSECSKREILHFYDLPDDRMTVIHHGTPELLQSGEVPTARATAFDGAILFVGARNDYKNFARFLAAVAPLVSSGEAPSVACVGGGMWSEREKRLARQHGLDGRMTLHLGVSDAELHQAYSSAALFVFPSLSEGFGIPLLEAMSAGCPIVASDIPAFREVAGDAAIYCNALDSSSMRERVRSLLADTWSRTRQIELGRVRVQNFSLKQTAAATAEVYRRCLT
jgi:glycosyltransferase involved in cell wall biosynthesis